MPIPWMAGQSLSQTTQSGKIMRRFKLLLAVIFMQGGIALSQPTQAANLVQELQQQAKAARFQIQQMPREAAMGYPVPVAQDGRIWLAFPYFLSRGFPPNAPEVSPFGWIVWVDAMAGEETRNVSLEADLEKSLGEFAIDSTLDFKGLQALEGELFKALSQLLDVATDPQRPLNGAEKEAAETFRKIWGRITPKALADQYYQLNPQWFDALGISP